MSDYKVNLEIDSQVNELFAKTKVIQKFRNPQSIPLELKVYIYKKKEILFSSFTANIGDSIKVKSKVIKKEKGEEKYNDAIASGNAAIYVIEDTYNNQIILNMGNIPPNEEIVLISEFLQLTESSKNYEFEFFRNFPIFKGNDTVYQNIDLKGKIEIRTNNKIINLQKQILLNNLKIIEEKNNKNENIYLIKYKIDKLPEFEEKLDYIPSSKIYFDFKNDDFIQLNIYYQKSNINPKENSYILNLKNNKTSEKLNPALFIFLIDQSGSMDYGKDVIPIKVVSKALELFLQSLPVGSYYQLIGFGSNFKKYDETPKEYTKENINNSLKIIKSLEADLGGTDIYTPLKSIYENEQEYNNIKLPKNIFLLTDGEINNKENTLEIIEEYSSKFSIYSIGIGDDFDQDLIKNAGIIGKGGYNFCQNLDNLNTIIVSEINKAINPYIQNLSIKTSLDDNNILKLYDIPEIIRSNQIINIGYITENKIGKINVEMEFFDEKNTKKKYNIIPKELEIGDDLSKLIINKYLFNNKNDKEVEELSLKYQILSKNTSLFAEIELSDKISNEMKSQIIGKKDDKNNYYSSDDNINYNINKSDIVMECYINDEEKCMEESDEKAKIDDEIKYKIKDSPEKNKKEINNIINSPPKKNESTFWDLVNRIFSFFKIFNFCKHSKEDIDMEKENEFDNNIQNNKNENDLEEIYDIQNNMNEEDLKENNNNNKNNMENKEYIMKIINSQDFIEGFWEYNDQTKYVKEKYLNKYNLIKSKLNLNDKTIITILVIYFIEKEHLELLNELNLIIQKAKLYIKKETNQSYEEIIKII